MAAAPQRPDWRASQHLQDTAQEDWLEGLRDWIQLCQCGHEPREAWLLLERSQSTLS
jgi:hypothetical protein